MEEDMRKLSLFFMGAAISCAFLANTNAVTADAAEQTVYVGGMTAGFTLKTGGAQIIGLSEVITENGVRTPALDAGIRTGDIIKKVCEIRVESISELNEIVDKSQGRELSLQILRGKETMTFTLKAVQEKQSSRYKIGVLVRESVSGIGTVTYIDKKTGRFGALGHTVVGDNNEEMKMSDGLVYECSIVGVCRGVRGKAGELRGMFLNDKHLGSAEKLCNCGIFGTVSKEFQMDTLMSAVANSQDVKPGNAWIYSTINGVTPQKYEIEIVKVDKFNRENKNYVIKITDNALISETGGIVQGMSGSPIMQEGKLVGAVTHVFLNDPTRGYGISIEEMLNE
jgi:stage IV sporulation protein B